jgi:site-specific recombinase XerD
MDGSVTLSNTQLAEVELENAFAAAKRYAKKSRADSTWRAYENDWRQFEAWCSKVNLPTLPADPDTVAMFVASQASDGLNPSTLDRRLAAIRLVHLGAGHASPHNTIKVTEVMRGIRRDWGRPPEKKAAALDEDIKKMADAVDPESTKGLRDRALLLFGFAGAFRRSELVALNTWNLAERDEGLKVTIEKSKTDQESEGQVIAIVRQLDSPYCPIQALQDWLTVAEVERGALFRRMYRGDKVGQSRLSAQTVALVVKEYASRAGLDWERYAGHSLRSGFLTSAARNRASIFKMADQSRHKSLDVLKDYIRDEDLFNENAGGGLLKQR